VGKPEGIRLFGTPRYRWVDNIKTDLLKWDWGVGMNLIDLAQNTDRWRALVNGVMKLRIP
jgi:hypothetical protein